MQRLSLFGQDGGARRILAIGAHADDIEIGCGGTLLRLVHVRRAVPAMQPAANTNVVTMMLAA